MSQRQPASIRTNNPGAMWPGPSASRFGSTGYENLADGNKIAIFPDVESGAAAQFDLLASKYAGMPFNEAIRKWSGGNHSDAYATQIAKQIGVDPRAPLTKEMLADPNVAIPLARSMAGWEAGRGSPLTDQQWASAHARAFGGDPSTYNTTSPAGGVSPETLPTPQVASVSTPAGEFGGVADQIKQALGYGDDNSGLGAPTTQFGSLSAAATEPADDGLMRLPAMPRRKIDLGKLRAVLASRGSLGVGRA